MSRIKEKIAALRAKTKDAGCTEAEALAAAALAAELMARHGLSEADMVMTEASAHDRTKAPTWRTDLGGTIACCTNTALIIVSEHQGSTHLFIGRDPGPEIAIYLRDVCFRAVDKALADFKASRFYRRRRSLATRREAAANFTEAMTRRLRSRLLELFAQTLSQQATIEANEARDARFPSGRSIKAREVAVPRYPEALAAGWKAGNQVPLNHGVGGDAQRLKLPGQVS